MIDKGRCYHGSILNSIICECECDTSCSIGQYLDYKNCKRTRKELINQLVKEWRFSIIKEGFASLVQ